MRFAVLFILLIGLIYAVSNEIKIETQVLKSTQVPVTHVVEYEITVDKEIIDDSAELIGRTYLVTVHEEATGFFLNADGVLLTHSRILNETLFKKHAIEQIESQIVADLANIEHIDKYGVEANAQEISAYSDYFQTEIGPIYDNVYVSDPDVLGFQSTSDALFIQINERVIPAHVISQDNGALFIYVEGNDYPSIEFSSSEGIQPGDIVYVVTSNETTETPLIEPTVVQDITAEKILFDRSIEPLSLILDKFGQPIAIGIDDANEAQITEDFATTLRQNQIINSESPTTKAYREALRKYSRGDYDSALEKFEEVLTRYPYHTDALSYKNSISETPPSPFEGFQNHPLRDWVLLFAGLAIGLIVLRRLFR